MEADYCFEWEKLGLIMLGRNLDQDEWKISKRTEFYMWSESSLIYHWRGLYGQVDEDVS